MLVAGVDIGTRRARIVTIHPHLERTPAVHAFESEQESPTLGWAACNWAADVWSHRRPGVIWIEQPRGHPRHQFALGRMAGYLLTSVGEDATVDFITPTEWRKLIGLKGNATKAEVIAWARKETGHELDEHAADAYGIARAILAHGASV